MICSEKELSILRRLRESTASDLAQLDSLISSATQRQSVETAPQTTQKPVDQLVAQKLALDADADHIISHWEHLTGYKAPHSLVVSWLQEHGKAAVVESCNKMLAKRSKTEMDGTYQRNFVAKVLRESVVKPAPQGAITI